VIVTFSELMTALGRTFENRENPDARRARRWLAMLADMLNAQTASLDPPSPRRDRRRCSRAAARA
jgi:hypothetical protein